MSRDAKVPAARMAVARAVDGARSGAAGPDGWPWRVLAARESGGQELPERPGGRAAGAGGELAGPGWHGLGGPAARTGGAGGEVTGRRRRLAGRGRGRWGSAGGGRPGAAGRHDDLASPGAGCRADRPVGS